jgi:DNA topoisomerase-1
MGRTICFNSQGGGSCTIDLERAIEIINAKQKEDAPIAWFDEKPVTKGKDVSALS